MDTKAAFEKWWKDQSEQLPPKMIAFSAWQASRAAIEIELPDGDMHMTYSGHQKLMLPNLGVRNAITSHGIKVKS